MKRTEPLTYGSITAEQFDEEIEKGMADVREGKIYSADDIEIVMNRDYGIQYYGGWKHLSEMVGAFIMEIFMGKIVACVLIVIVLLIGVVVLGFIQMVRAWSDIFR